MQGLEIGLTKMQAVVHNSLNVAVARNEMKAVYSCIWPPGTLGGCDPSAAVNGFFHLCDRQSASANGPAWAALRKHRHLNTRGHAVRPFRQGPGKDWGQVVIHAPFRVNDGLQGLWMLESIGRGQIGQMLGYHPWGTYGEKENGEK